MLLEDARIGEIVVQSGRPLADGRAPRRTASRRWCAFRYPYDALVRGAHVSLRRRAVRPRHLARRPAAVGVDGRGQRRPVPARVGPRQRCCTATSTPLSEFRFGQSVPESFVFSHDGRYLYGSSYYTGVSNIFRYEVATGDVEAVSNAETGFFRPVPLADGRLVVLELHRRGLRSGDHRAASARGRQRDHVPRRRSSSRKYPDRQDLAGAAAEHRRRREADHDEGPVLPVADLGVANAYPGAAGLQELDRARLPRQRRGSAAVRELGITAAYTPDRQPAGRRARPRRHHRPLPRLARQPRRGTGRTSTTSSARQSAAARATPPSSATTTC